VPRRLLALVEQLPTQDGVGCNHAGEGREAVSAEDVAFHHQTASLIVGEAESSRTGDCAEDAVLLKEIVNGEEESQWGRHWCMVAACPMGSRQRSRQAARRRWADPGPSRTFPGGAMRSEPSSLEGAGAHQAAAHTSEAASAPWQESD
jgi:hypothetical protein